MACQSYLSGA